MAAAGGDPIGACESERVSVDVFDVTGQTVTVNARLAGTVEDLKALIAEKLNLPPVDELVLIHRCRILLDHQTLESYGIREGNMILMVRYSVSIGAESSGTVAPAYAFTAAHVNSSVSTVSSPESSAARFGSEATESNVTAAAIIAGNDDLGDFPVSLCAICSAAGLELRERLVQNSEEMFDMMTPEMMRLVILANPRVWEIVNQNLRLRRIVNDDEILRGAIQLARNPELMQEALNGMEFTRVYTNNHEVLMDVEAIVKAFVRPTPPDRSSQNLTMSSESTGRILAPNPQLRSYPAPNQQLSAQVGAQANDASGLDPLVSQVSEAASNKDVPIGINNSTPLEDVYGTQLVQLQEMGFTDTEENTRALQTTEGNVQAAVEQLHRDMGK